MQFRDGTEGQKLLFAVLVCIYLLGLAVDVEDKLERVGQPDVGWMLEGGLVSPTRRDASEAGLLGGGRALFLNGVKIDPYHSGRHDLPPGMRSEIGATNTLTLRRPGGEIRDITIPVRVWEWKDVVFTEGATGVLGLLFFVVGATTFVLRPYQVASWALLSLCSVAGGLLMILLIPVPQASTFGVVYFMCLAGVMCYLPIHAALAFPVVHSLLLRHPRVLWLIYGLGFAQAAIYMAAWNANWSGPFAHARSLGAGAMLVAILFFVGRCALLSLRAPDPLVAQRSRILLAGAAFGLAPLAFVQFMQETFGALAVDNRFLYWPLGLFLLALAHVTLRQELLSARIAVRRAFLYASAVLVLTALAWVLTAVHRYAVAALLLPLLYMWPRFDARLNRRLYPKRVRFPELLRAIGAEMAAAPTTDAVLGALAGAPTSLCDARRGVAFAFAAEGGASETVRTSDDSGVSPGRPLADEPAVQLMRTTRKEVLRSRMAVQPQYSNIAEECYAGFDRLQADMLLPMVRDNRVVGGLAVGPRVTRDVYGEAEIDAISTAAQQAVQAMISIEATERLRARELEFADLKRFFPPQIIDRVMERGGAAELRSQRKLVTVFFADLRGFTSFSESVEPEEVMATLAEYHEAMGGRIAEFSGTLERFAGDGFMVFFNDPVEQPDHAERAVRMALAMRADAQRLHEGWAGKGYDIDLGMGIHTGYATCGFIGYEGRRDYGVIGNVTNLASRLSDAAGAGEILITARVRSELRNGFRTEPAGELTLKGFHQPQPAFRLL